MSGKMKRKKTYILFILSALVALPAFAQQKEYSGRIGITPLALEQRGDSLHVKILYDISGVNVDSRRSISLIPVLAAADRRKELPEVTVKGRNNYKAWKREVALMGKQQRSRYKANGPYAVVKGYPSGGDKQIAYEKTIFYEPWMESAGLDMRESLCGCGGAPRMLDIFRVADRVSLEQKELIPYLAYIQPVSEAVKERAAEAELFLNFPVSDIRIYPDYMSNSAELQKATALIAELKDNPDLQVRKIHVVGYASPEGTLANNQRLSEGRARALADYLMPSFGYPASIYHVEFGGENWGDLEKIVETLDVPWKAQVLNIIRNVPNEIDYKTNTSRKKQLMDLKNGEPYRYLYKEFYPSLRKAVCRVDYQVQAFDVNKAKELIGTRPQDLSLNEMYLVANQYKSGTPQFVEVFETAVKMFPDDPVANLNAANAALERRDTVSAEKYLERIKAADRTPQWDNAMGVLEALKGNYDSAANYLKSASQAGVGAAAENLRQIVR